MTSIEMVVRLCSLSMLHICLAFILIQHYFENGRCWSVQKVVLSNSDVAFECIKNTTTPYVWDFFPVGLKNDAKQGEIRLYNGLNVNPKLPFKSIVNVTVTNTDQRLQSTLTLITVNADNAGTYVCSEADRELDKYTFDLIVFEGEPLCTLNSSTDVNMLEENSTLEINCDVMYRGTLQMEFRCVPHLEHEIIERNTEEVMTLARPVRYKKRFHVDAKHSGQVQECRLFINSTNYDVTNINVNSTSWLLETLNVTFGPRNVRIDKQDGFLKCSSDGYPIPNYQWFDMESNATVQIGDRLNICQLEKLKRKSGELFPSTTVEVISVQCIASIKNRTDAFQPYNMNLTFPTDYRKLCDFNDKSVLFLLILTFCLLAACVTVICVLVAALMCRRPNKKRAKSDRRRLQQADMVDSELRVSPAYRQRIFDWNDVVSVRTGNPYDEIFPENIAESISPYAVTRPSGYNELNAETRHQPNRRNVGYVGLSNPESPVQLSNSQEDGLLAATVAAVINPYSEPVDSTAASTVVTATSGYHGLNPGTRQAPLPPGTRNYVHLNNENSPPPSEFGQLPAGSQNVGMSSVANDGDPNVVDCGRVFVSTNPYSRINKQPLKLATGQLATTNAIQARVKAVGNIALSEV